MRIALDLSLLAAAACAWLGCLGVVRLRSALDRLHGAGFLSVTLGPLLFLAAVLQDGLSVRTVKILLIAVLGAIFGAGVSHAMARAISHRNPAAKELPE